MENLEVNTTVEILAFKKEVLRDKILEAIPATDWVYPGDENEIEVRSRNDTLIEVRNNINKIIDEL